MFFYLFCSLITGGIMGYAGYRIHLAHIKNRELQERLLRSEYDVELLTEAVLKEHDSSR